MRTTERHSPKLTPGSEMLKRRAAKVRTTGDRLAVLIGVPWTYSRTPSAGVRISRGSSARMPLALPEHSPHAAVETCWSRQPTEIVVLIAFLSPRINKVPGIGRPYIDVGPLPYLLLRFR